ncbi:MAG: NRDE family protein [Planctomycetes bacterium]|nr:NRDE family protein [Planctomycetota bacterium]
MCIFAAEFGTSTDGSLFTLSLREEFRNRPFSRVSRTRRGNSTVFAPIDDQGGGTWLMLSEHGLVATLINRRLPKLHRSGVPSRGEIPFLFAGAKNMADAREIIREIDHAKYNPFMLILVDGSSGIVYSPWDEELPQDLEPGLHVFGSCGLEERKFEKIESLRDLLEAEDNSRQRFEPSLVESILRDSDYVFDYERGVCIDLAGWNFGTVCSHLYHVSPARDSWGLYEIIGFPKGCGFESREDLLFESMEKMPGTSIV